MRLMKLPVLLLSMAAMLATGAGSAIAANTALPPTRLAWLGDSGMTAVQRMPQGTVPVPLPDAALRTPLGSVWKLFVYGYLSGRAVQEPVYHCATAVREADDGYCCDPGGSIGRDQALAQSCGPYFDTQRVGISAADWTRFWKENNAPVWLQQLNAMRPDMQVPVHELLTALQRMPMPARTAARQALQPMVVRDDAVLAALGSGPRFKTWSWHVDAQRAGGAAGWLADGTPFWLGSAGTSRSALQVEARWMAAQWSVHGLDAPAPDAAAVSAQPCIEVVFFERYPIRSVRRVDGAADVVAPAGPMRGRYRIAFENGQQLVMDAVPAQILRYEGQGAAGARIAARLPLEDYVARVVDREGDARETQAARALAVAARSYVLQNAPETEACRQIADGSRTQRVSPNPPTVAARAVAAFTEGLVVSGVPVRYHRDQASPGVMSWQATVAAGRDGKSFVTMLSAAYPGGTLAPAQATTDCTPLPEAQSWLASRQQRWRQTLRAQAGYQALDDTLRVCQLAMGVPHSDQRRLIIRVREWQTREGRVTLIHEYLHLAFREHPRGQDEVFIEQLAQQLADL